MGRRPHHSVDEILDVAQELVLSGGAPAGAISAISRAGGFASGSVYHRFASRDELLARLWIRAVRRTQARILGAAGADAEDPVDAAVAMAVAVVDGCVHQRADARLLLSFRREDLVDKPLPEPLLAELRALNRPVEIAVGRLTRRLAGTSPNARSRQRVALAVFDLPYGAVRRHLVADRPIPRGTRQDVAVAVRAVLSA